MRCCGPARSARSQHRNIRRAGRDRATDASTDLCVSANRLGRSMGRSGPSDYSPRPQRRSLQRLIQYTFTACSIDAFKWCGPHTRDAFDWRPSARDRRDSLANHHGGALGHPGTALAVAFDVRVTKACGLNSCPSCFAVGAQMPRHCTIAACRGSPEYRGVPAAIKDQADMVCDAVCI